ncbi:ATPase [Aureococcus anophagefferens]|nr:ATPase [Aureococcus anophagefferens]
MSLIAPSREVALVFWQPANYFFAQTSGYPVHLNAVSEYNPAKPLMLVSFTRWAYEAIIAGVFHRGWGEDLSRRPSPKDVDEDVEKGAATTVVAVAGVDYSVRLPDGAVRPILADVAFKADGLTAVMGPSGAGKSTLLDVVAGRKTTGFGNGSILYDGVHPTAEDRKRLQVYVMQNDVSLGTLSVEETLAVALNMYSTLFQFNLFFSGYSIPVSQVKWYFHWATQTSFARPAFDALLVNELRGVESYDDDEDADYWLDYWGLEGKSRMLYLGQLLLVAAVVHALALLAATLCNFQRQ